MDRARRATLVLAMAGVLAASPALAQMQVLETPMLAPEAGAAPVGPDTPCAADPFTIAQMPWPSAAILAHVHAQILAAEFDCSVQVVSGDVSATISSMATTQQPAVAPEMWVSRAAEVWNGAVRAQAVRSAGATYGEGSFEGWFVPDYVRQNHPDLTSAAVLGEYWRVFAEDAVAPVPDEGEGEQAEGEAEAAPPSDARGRFISCPADWACALINRNLLAAYGLEDRFEIVEPADRFALDRMLADAVSRREPVLAYYWQPNAVLDQLSMLPLDMGGFNGDAALCLAQTDCVAMAPSAFAPDTVITAAANWVFVDAPEVASYFQRAAMPFAEMNRLLAWQAETGADAEETAAHFVATQETVWRAWLAPQ
jgi:glycine betaine/proline transport system substrate-binding protein